MFVKAWFNTVTFYRKMSKRLRTQSKNRLQTSTSWTDETGLEHGWRWGLWTATGTFLRLHLSFQRNKNVVCKQLNNLPGFSLSVLCVWFVVFGVEDWVIYVWVLKLKNWLISHIKFVNFVSQMKMLNTTMTLTGQSDWICALILFFTCPGFKLRIYCIRLIQLYSAL